LSEATDHLICLKNSIKGSALILVKY
jgi:hypothetical protein